MRSSQIKSDGQTWDKVLSGDVNAYKLVVESHQSAVSAVAYAIVGDFPISQDIAQETFWVAWTKRNSLRDVGRLGSWLRGIARNLAKQWRRSNKKRVQTSSSELAFEPADTGQADPASQSIAREEQQVVWNALEQIPENYREVLTLYYRQSQSVTDVASIVGISEEAARQRLSRGRAMLRGRVSQLIEGVLDRSKPDASFSAKVIAGLVALGAAGKTATASASAISASKVAGSASASLVAAKSAFTAGVSTGLVGGLLGAVGGLGGGFIGTWLPAQLAPTETERQLMLHEGRVMFGMGLVFTVAIFALSLSFAFIGFDPLHYIVALVALMLAFGIPMTLKILRLNRLLMELRKHVDPDGDPNQGKLAGFGKIVAGHHESSGRSYTSKITLFGYPLVDIQVSGNNYDYSASKKQPRKHAIGWIAVGDKASGILFAAGGFARGFVAVGGVSVGAISIGGIAVGIVSLAGLAVGLLALGGGAVGYHAAGGGAVGWQSAAGGAAFSHHAAMGGLAVASEYAVGGSASAAEANTPLAKEVIERDTMKAQVEWLAKNQLVFIVFLGVTSIIPVLFTRWIYNLPPDVEEPEKEMDSAHRT